MRRFELILRAILVLLFTYLLVLGATFTGVLTPEFKQPTLIIMTLTLIVWLSIHWWRGWQWHKTPLDWVFLLWSGAFALSLLANLDFWRRIVMALWYMAVYIGVWYVLLDVIANRGLKRKTLVDALLITGIVVMIFAFLQVQGWANTQLPLMRAGLIDFELPRPVSTIGNPNALATFFVVLTPFVLSRAASARNRLERIIMSGYALAAILLVFLTFSRGGWLGLLMAALVWGILLLLHYDLLSLRRLCEWWATCPRSQRIVLLSSSVLILICVFIVVLFIVNSLADSERSLAMRTILYQPAIDLFVEKPLVGHGLFMFGRGYERLVSLPPQQPHSHAHNIILNVAAELGLVGLVTLFVTGGVILWTMRRNWQTASKNERLELIGAIAAVAGFAIHHMLDTTAMMPAIVLTGLLALVLALAPFAWSPVRVVRQRFQTLGLMTVWVALLIAGFQSAEIYRQYVEALRTGLTDKNYAGAAEQLQRIIDADPALGLYQQQQAYLWGLAANEGDTDAAEKAIVAYDRFLELEPQSAVSWANKAALHWQLDQSELALESMQQAVKLAPGSWQLGFNLAVYTELIGDIETARQLYERYWSLCNQHLGGWPETPLTLEISQSRLGTCLNEQKTDSDWIYKNFILPAFSAFSEGKRTEALALLEEANRLANSAESEAWVHIGRAWIARWEGNEQMAEQEQESAHALVSPNLLKEDYIFGTNIAHFQFLRLTISRQFLPQIYYPTGNLNLLANLASLN